jgi:3-phosphoshikimate 1-carboxyvinyltransferase
MAPPSKASTHRALIAGLLSSGTTELANPLLSDDTNATANAISALGAQVNLEADRWTVHSTGKLSAPRFPIDCGESGVTLRFMIPIVSLTGEKSVLRASESLMRRPLEPLEEALEQLHVRVLIRGGTILVKGDPPEGGSVTMRGDVSSQFISGLLFAGCLMDNGLELLLTTPAESRNYVLLTTEIMRQHGVRVQSNQDMTRFEIAPGQKYLPTMHRIHGDYSSAAFILAAAAITHSKVLVHDLPPTQLESDSVFLKILSQMGAKIEFVDDIVIIEGRELTGIHVDIRDSPDLGPILAVLACYAEGETLITGAARLRYKESDRLASITSELAAIGAHITETEDGLLVHGPSRLRAGEVQSHKDHRIAMALAVAALGASGKVAIRDAECVTKSYPTFFQDLRSVGVKTIEW